MRKILMILILGIFLISFSTALEINSDLGTFKQGQCISLYQLCESCTFVNVTSVTHPNSTLTRIDQTMTKNTFDYNYSFCDTTKTGDYTYNVCGDKNGTTRCENIDFKITPSGEERGFGLFLVLAIAAIVLLFLNYFIGEEFLLFFSGVAWLLAGMYAMIYGFGDLADLYTRGIAGIILGIGLVFVVASIYNLSKGDDD